MLSEGRVVFPNLHLLGDVTAVLLGIIAVLALRALQLDDPANILIFGHDTHSETLPATLLAQNIDRSVSIERAITPATSMYDFSDKDVKL